MSLKCETELYSFNKKLYACGTSITMDLIGGKWKSVILYHLIDGSKRYNEIRRKLPVATERTLSLQLKQLEEDKIIKRKVYTSKPPLKVEYSLTEFGKTLIPLLQMLADWGNTIASEKAVIVKNKLN